MIFSAHLLSGENKFDVQVFVDEEFRENPAWYREVQAALDYVNTRYAQEFGISFNWLEPVYWETDNSHTTIFDLLDQLVSDTALLKPGMVLGLTAQTPLQGYELGVARYFSGHAVVKKTDFMLDTILHEFGHVFGAVHVEGEVWLMNAHATVQEKPQFDRWNYEIIKLHIARRFNPAEYPVSKEASEKIVSIYDELLTLQKSDQILLINLGSHLSEIGRHDKAVSVLRDAETYFYLRSVEEGTDNAKNKSYRKQAREALSYALCKKGAWQDAVYILDELYMEDPGNLYIAWYLGLAYTNLTDFSRARDVFEEILISMPDSVSLYLNLGYVYEQMGIPSVAEEKYRTAMHLNPDRCEPYMYLGNFSRNQGKLDDAIRFYGESINKKPDEGRVFEQRGITYHNLGEKDKALADYMRALELNPQLRAARYNAGLLYLEQSRIDDAEKEFIALVKTDPDYALGYLGLGTAYLKKGDFAHSRNMLEQAVKKDKNLAEAHANLYQIYQHLGLEKKAKKTAKKYHKLTGKQISE
ncbi:MAG: tetratricopeptide repeat protein [bacterium]